MEIVQKGNFHGDLIDTVLENRNIENKDLYLNPDNSTDSDPFKLKDVEKGVELVLHHLKENSFIQILVDADADGFMSASLMYNYLKNDLNRNQRIEYILHSTKAHGLTNEVMKKVKEDKPDLLIIPDAGSNDVERIAELEGRETDVLVIDHHVVDTEAKRGIIINNQLCENTNSNFTGVGVVYKFLQVLEENQGFKKLYKYLDLLAVGQIGDGSDISDNEIRNLVIKGLDNIENGFLKVAAEQKNGLGVELAPKDMSFGVIPLINAVSRMGIMEERDVLFKALSNQDTDQVFRVTKKKKNKSTGKFDKVDFDLNIYQYAFELCTKTKSRQDREVKKMVKKIDEDLVDDAGVIIAYSPDNKNPGITGLIANKIMSKYDKPVLLLNEQEKKFTGSGRGHEKTLDDFRKWCEDSGLVEFAQGHDNAFGIAISKDKIDDFKEYSRKIKKQDVRYEVDLISDRPDKKYCEQIDRNKRLFGGAVSEPFVGFKSLSVPKKFISQRGSLLNIYSWGVGMVQFGSNPYLFEEMMEYPEDNVKLDIVGFYGMNEWSGKKKPQLIIKDVEVVYSDEDSEYNTNEEITVENIVF